MSDILDYEYAVILLTEAEFNGPLCLPPKLGANPYLDADKQPKWMTVGSGYAQFSDMGGLGPGDTAARRTLHLQNARSRSRAATRLEPRDSLHAARARS